MSDDLTVTIFCDGTDPDPTGEGDPFRCGELHVIHSVPPGTFTLDGARSAARADAETDGWSCTHRALDDRGTAMVDLCPRHAQAASVPG